MSNVEQSPVHEHQLELFVPHHAGQLALELYFAAPEPPTVEDHITLGEN